MKAAQVNLNVSDLINEAIRLSLKEDVIDIKAVRNRRHEPTRSLEVILKNLKGWGAEVIIIKIHRCEVVCLIANGQCKIK
jgi:hypothetical protein